MVFTGAKWSADSPVDHSGSPQYKRCVTRADAVPHRNAGPSWLLSRSSVTICPQRRRVGDARLTSPLAPRPVSSAGREPGSSARLPPRTRRGRWDPCHLSVENSLPCSLRWTIPRSRRHVWPQRSPSLGTRWRTLRRRERGDPPAGPAGAPASDSPRPISRTWPTPARPDAPPPPGASLLLRLLLTTRTSRTLSPTSPLAPRASGGRPVSAGRGRVGPPGTPPTLPSRATRALTHPPEPWGSGR